MRTFTILLWLIGIALMFGLVVIQGFGKVTEALVQSGWGLLAMVAYSVIPFSASAVCWWILLGAAGRPPICLRLLDSVGGNFC